MPKARYGIRFYFSNSPRNKAMWFVDAQTRDDRLEKEQRKNNRTNMYRIIKAIQR